MLADVSITFLFDVLLIGFVSLKKKNDGEPTGRLVPIRLIVSLQISVL